MPYTPPVRRGLVCRVGRGWSGKIEEKLDEISIFDVGWDKVKFSHSGAPMWVQQGNYNPKAREFEGYGQTFVSRESEEMVSQVDYRCLLVGVDFFLDYEAYLRFLREQLQAKVVEEIWEPE